jgi:hypothetical protein
VDVIQLFTNAGYIVETTAPDSSHQNGPGERPHRTIADAIRTRMLSGAALPPKFWPYTFHHFLRLYNVTVHGDKTASPYEVCTNRKPDLSNLRVFGCRVYALPARPRRPDKLLPDSRTGIFLGFAWTMKNILYFDITTETVKSAQHVIFDESMRDLVNENFSDLDIIPSPFTKIDTLQFDLDMNDIDHPFGFTFAQCQ